MGVIENGNFRNESFGVTFPWGDAVKGEWQFCDRRRTTYKVFYDVGEDLVVVMSKGEKTYWTIESFLTYFERQRQTSLEQPSSASSDL